MNDIAFFWIAFVCYFGSFIIFSIYFAFAKKSVSDAASFAALAGFIMHTIALIMRWISAKHAPFSNMFEYMNVMAWVSVLGLLIIVWKMKKPLISAFISPVAFILMGCAALLPKDINQQLMPALQSIWFNIHVSLTVIAEGAFAIAFAVSIMYLIRTYRTFGTKSPKSSLTQRFPSLETLDDINYKAVSIGYPLFTIGALIAGSIWASRAWGTFWGWDPKEVGALIIWIFYTVYIHARFVKGWKGKRAAWMSIIGFVMTILSFFGNLILGGLHAYI